MIPSGSAGMTHGGASPGGVGLVFALWGFQEAFRWIRDEPLDPGIAFGAGRLGIGFCFGVVEDEGPPVRSMSGMFLISIGFLSQKDGWSVAAGGRSSRGKRGRSHRLILM